ncbi:MAG: hypothetical protein NVSMB46_02910 [Candidatus Saccharimonadales bacterium]
MQSIIILGLIAIVPAILALIFRVNAVFLFLSVAVGEILERFMSSTIIELVGSYAKGPNVGQYVPVALLATPVLLSILFLRKTLPSSKIIFHIIPLLATGAASSIFILSLLPLAFRTNIYNSSYGHILKSSQDLIIVGASLIILLLVWATYRHRPEGNHTKHR